jgi:hypothetical protein
MRAYFSRFLRYRIGDREKEMCHFLLLLSIVSFVLSCSPLTHCGLSTKLSFVAAQLTPRTICHDEMKRSANNCHDTSRSLLARQSSLTAKRGRRRRSDMKNPSCPCLSIFRHQSYPGANLLLASRLLFIVFTGRMHSPFNTSTATAAEFILVGCGICM